MSCPHDLPFGWIAPPRDGSLIRWVVCPLVTYTQWLRSTYVHEELKAWATALFVEPAIVCNGILWIYSPEPGHEHDLENT